MHVQVLTDVPEVRFAVGGRLLVAGSAPAGARAVGELVVDRARWHHGRLILGFRGVTGREGAEALRGRLLEITAGQVGDAGPEAWWDRDLVGLSAELADGGPLGRVREVVHLAGQDLLAVTRPDGAELLVPFVAAVVPVVDPAGGRVVVDPPEGLLEL